MRKASEMYELSYKHYVRCCDDDLYLMEEMMVEAAKNGNFSIYWPSALRGDVKETLISLGYNILLELSSCTRISWEQSIKGKEETT